MQQSCHPRLLARHFRRPRQGGLGRHPKDRSAKLDDFPRWGPPLPPKSLGEEWVAGALPLCRSFDSLTA